MAFYIVRVELHGAKTEAEYEVLHKAMAARGFHRSMTDSGKTVHLPSATYCMSSNYTAQQIEQLTEEAAKTTGKTFWVLVVQSAGLWWRLPEV
jgi:hypothetical protein